MLTSFLAVNVMCCASLANAFTALSDRNFHQAVYTFMANKSDATSTYGGIEGAYIFFPIVANFGLILCPLALFVALRLGRISRYGYGVYAR